MRLFCFGLILVTSLMSRVEVRAQLPQALLTSIFPPGAKAGSTAEVTVSGTDLDEPSGLMFSDSRITATAKPGSPNQFQIEIPAEISESIVDVRFAGRFGVSNPRAFAIGKRPEVIAITPNNSPTNALELPLETTINSRVAPNTIAWFRFAAEAGQRLFIRVEAREIDSQLVPNLTVTDTSGREVALARRREWLDFIAPVGGTYLLKLSDQTFRGGNDHYFRLTLATGPQLDFAVPNVLQIDTTNQVTIYGRNLPGGEPSEIVGVDGKILEQLTVEFFAPIAALPLSAAVEHLRKPAAASIHEGVFSWRLDESGGSSNPLLFMVTTNRVAAAKADELAEVELPCEFSGIFPRRGQVSGVTFRANKGDVFWLELFADRLGFPSDPHAVVQRVRATKGAQGETLYADVLEIGDTDGNFGDREFNTITRDAAARFEAPQTGTYRVLVRDLFNLADDRQRYPYRLCLRRESPDFRLVSLPMPPPRVGEDRNVHVLPATVRRDQTIALKVLAFRRDGFNGEIELMATNLPPGVSMTPTRIFAGQNVGTLLLTASADAASMTQAIIFGSAAIGPQTIGDSSALASVVWPVADFNNESALARLNREAIISVISAEAAPVTITPVAPKPIEISAESKLIVPLSIGRRGEFQGSFNLKLAGHGALDKAKEVPIPEKATNITAEIDLAEAKLAAGTYTLWFHGRVAGKYRNNPEAVVVAETELQAAEKVLASVSEAEKPKAQERKKAAEAAKKAAEEKAKPRDVTVPVYSRPFIVTVLAGSKPEEKK